MKRPQDTCRAVNAKCVARSSLLMRSLRNTTKRLNIMHFSSLKTSRCPRWKLNLSDNNLLSSPFPSSLPPSSNRWNKKQMCPRTSKSLLKRWSRKIYYKCANWTTNTSLLSGKSPKKNSSIFTRLLTTRSSSKTKAKLWPSIWLVGKASTTPLRTTGSTPIKATTNGCIWIESWSTAITKTWRLVRNFTPTSRRKWRGKN